MAGMSRLTRLAAYLCFTISLVCLLGIVAEPELLAGGLIAGAFWGCVGAIALSVSKGLRSQD